MLYNEALLHKAWLETRSRFLGSLIGMVAICTYSVLHDNPLGAQLSPETWYYHVLHETHTRLVLLWVLAASLLMMGGLVQEYAVGASDFTLALPVSRARLMMARIGLGFAQSIALAIVPWTVIFLIDYSTGKATSVSNAVFHVVLLVAGGSIFVGWGLLASSLVSGEYTAPAVNLGVALGVCILLGNKPISPLGLISGSEYLDLHTNLPASPLPWARLLTTMLIAAVFAVAALKIVQRREF
jgi:ABC-type transport system involved in multi-copper enzyme maturation permease subunit